jgi:outer membrane protein TolC
MRPEATATSTVHSFLHPPAFALAALVVSACAAARPEVDAEASIAESLALPGAVVFRNEGGPLDVEAEPAAALPLAEAVRRAVESSPELQAALARVRAAEAEAELAGLLPNPVLSLVFRFPEGGGSVDVEAGLAADLLGVLQRPRRSRAAGHRLEAEAAAALSSALDVVAEVRGLYAGAQVLEELVPALEGRLAVLDRLREVAQARLDLGEGTRHDVTALDSRRLELAVEVSQRRAELRLARLALARRIGEPSSAAGWQLDPWHGPPVLSEEESPWIERALQARPEILAIQWELLARGEEIALAGWSGFDGAAVGVDAEREGGDWSVGPSVETPLSISGAGAARERRARALAAEARHRLVEARRAVVEDVRSSLLALGASRANLDRVVRELIPLQERRRDEVDAAYRLGHVDVTALLLAEQALQESQMLRIGLERETSEALLRLERSVGGRSSLDSMAAQPAPEPRS